MTQSNKPQNTGIDEQIFNLLCDADMELRNKNYWGIAAACEKIVKIARDHAKKI